MSDLGKVSVALPAIGNLALLKAAEERSAIKLAAVAGTRRMQDLMPEVNRRAAFYAADWQASPRNHGGTPLCAALDSVARDVTFGWL